MDILDDNLDVIPDVISDQLCSLCFTLHLFYLFSNIIIS